MKEVKHLDVIDSSKSVGKPQDKDCDYNIDSSPPEDQARENEYNAKTGQAYGSALKCKIEGCSNTGSQVNAKRIRDNKSGKHFIIPICTECEPRLPNKVKDNTIIVVTP